jgi:hypothetical protein
MQEKKHISFSCDTSRAEAQQNVHLRRNMASHPLPCHPCVRYFHLELEPELEPGYIEKVRMLYPSSNDHNERQAHTKKMLESILGLERMKFTVGSPSGHSGVTEDPTLAQWNKEKFYSGVLDCVHDYDTQRHRQQQDLQRQAAEKQIKRQQDAALLEHHLLMYRQRLEQLIQFGPKFNDAIDVLERAADNGDILAMCRIANAMCNDILTPAQEILDAQKHDALIDIEFEGSRLLQDAWPLERLDHVLRLLQPEMPQFSDEVQFSIGFMLQGIEYVCRPILCAQAFKNPLAEEPQLPFATQPIPKSLAHHLADYGYFVAQQPLQQQQFQPQSQALLPMQFQQPLQLQPQPPPQAPAGDNAGKNFSSFSDLFSASKAAAANLPPVPDITVTPPSLNGGAVIKHVPSGSTSAVTNANGIPQANIRDVVCQKIQIEGLEFEDDLKTLVRDGRVHNGKRQALMNMLKWIDDYHGQDGLLGDQHDWFRFHVEHLVRRIANISNKERNQVDTRKLDVLANRVLKLWTPRA